MARSRSFLELIPRVFSLRSRPGAHDWKFKLLFLTTTPYCLRYFSELGNFWHNYPILWKSPKSGIHGRNCKAAFHFSLWTIHEFVLENPNLLTLGLTYFGVNDPLNFYPWKQPVAPFVEIAYNQVYFHIPKLARKKTHWIPPTQPLRKGETGLPFPFC